MEADESLILKIKNKDLEAYRILVERYQKIIFAICFNITKDRHEAENLAQDTFLQVYLSLSKYEGKGFKTWIGRIATNKCIDWKRKSQKKDAVEVVYLDEMLSTDQSIYQDIEQQLLIKENAKTIVALCNELPMIYRIVFNKFHIENKSYQQIAMEENISIKTVESRLYRAKKAMRERWKEESNETL